MLWACLLLVDLRFVFLSKHKRRRYLFTSYSMQFVTEKKKKKKRLFEVQMQIHLLVILSHF